MKPSNADRELVGASIESVAILGMGLIGGSIAKDIRENLPECSVFAIGESADITLAQEAGLVEGSIEYSDLEKSIDLVIIATPLDVVRSAAIKLAAQMGSRAEEKKPLLVIDVGSVKKEITATFEELTRQTPGVEFISTHPMAGTEFNGFQHARKHLFRNKPWIICPTEANSEHAMNAVEAFIRSLEAEPLRLEAEKHDEKSALVSHSVIALSNLFFDFVWQTDREALSIAGSGFDSTTRLASGNPEMHSSILKLNKDLIEGQLQAFTQYLLENGINNLDLAFFEANRTRRNHWIHHSKNLEGSE